MTVTTPNSALENSGGQTPLYDDASHQVVAARAKNVSTDGTTGIISGDMGVDVEITVAGITNDGTFAKESGGNLATLAGAVSGGKVAAKAASGDFATGSLVDLATLLTLAGTPTDANTVNSLMGRLTKLRDLLNSIAYDNTNEVRTSVYGKNSTAGDTPLGLDTSGRITSLIQAVAGTALAADQSNTILRTSLYGKGSAAGDTSLQLETIFGGLSVAQFIQYHIMAGHGFAATSGVLATATNANVYIAMGLLANNIGKNVYIYRISAGAQNTTGDIRLSAMTAFDATITAAITPANQNLNSGTTASATVKTTANSNTSPTSASGTLRYQAGSAANLGNNIEFLQQSSGIFIPASSTQGVTVWIKIPTAANTGQINMEWIEF